MLDCVYSYLNNIVGAISLFAQTMSADNSPAPVKDLWQEQIYTQCIIWKFKLIYQQKSFGKSFDI